MPQPNNTATYTQTIVKYLHNFDNNNTSDNKTPKRKQTTKYFLIQ